MCKLTDQNVVYLVCRLPYFFPGLFRDYLIEGKNIIFILLLHLEEELDDVVLSQCSLVPAWNHHTYLQMHYSLVPLSSLSVQGTLSAEQMQPLDAARQPNSQRKNQTWDIVMRDTCKLGLLEAGCIFRPEFPGLTG